MLSVDPIKLRAEIEASVLLRKKHTEVMEAIDKRVAGDDYRADWRADEDNYEAFEFQFIKNTVPSWVHNDPVVEVEGMLPMIDDQLKSAIEQGMNQWIPAVRFAETAIQIAVDTCVGYGVWMTSVEPLPGYDQAHEPVPLWPMIYRLPPHRFFQDAQGGRDQWRYRGHVWIQDKDDLLAAKNPDGSSVFDLNAVNGLPAEVGIDEEERQRKERMFRTDRNRVVGYELFMRETGLIYTLGFAATSGGGQSSGFLRPPRKWIGSSKGPYRVSGVFWPRDQVYPMGPLQATAARVRELNAHRGQMSDDAASAKTLLLVDKSKPENKAALENAPNGSIVAVEGLAGGFVLPTKTGGVDAGAAEYVERLRRDLRETAGMTVNDVGSLTDATAKEVGVVENAADVRTAFERAQFQACESDVLLEVATIMHNCDQVVFPITVKDPASGMDVPAIFKGGMGQGDDPTAFGRLRLKIQPYSSEYVDAGVKQRRALQNAQLILEMAPVMPMAPQINWGAIMDDLGESQNNKGLGKRYLNQQALGMMQEHEIMAQEMQMQLAANPPARPAPGGGKDGKKPPKTNTGKQRAKEHAA